MTGALVIFLFALLLIGGGLYLLARAQSRERQDEMALRMRMMGGDETAALAGLEAPREIGNPLLRETYHLLLRTGADVEPETATKILLGAALAVPVAMLLFGVTGGLLLIAVISVFGWGFLTRRAAARRAKALEQLPPFIEAVMRVLSAGNTLEEAIAASARESLEPLKPMMMSVGRQVRLGAPIEQVLLETGEIHQLRDIKVMALAASINRKYGGSLRNIFKSLVQTIRARDVAARELRALTAETRFSALVLSVIPVSLSLYIYIRNPAYYTTMWNDPVGRTTLVISILMQVVGIVVIMRMMRGTEDTA